MYMSPADGYRKIYYRFRGAKTEESRTKFWKESHSRGTMFVGGICSRGVAKLRFVEPAAKISSD